MDTGRAHPLRAFLPPLLATGAWLLLATRQSGAPDLLGRYSLPYATLLGLWGVNVGLLWRSALQGTTATSPFQAPSVIWRELVPIVATVAVLMLAERLFGTRALAPTEGAVLVLAAAILLQLIPRPAIAPPLLTNPATFLLLIVLTGLLVRIYAIDFGLPALYDPDEYWFVAVARQMIVDQNPNPGWFGHPGSTSIYLLAALYAGLHWILGAFGAAPSSDLYAFFNRHWVEIYLLGRLVSVAFAVATIVMTYAMAARLFQPAIGLVAAAFMALSPLHVSYSRLIRSDIQATFLVLVVFWFALDIVERGRWRSVLLAGLVTGMAAATKYPAVLISSTAGLAVVLAPGSWRRRLQMLGGYGAVAAAGAFMSSPYLFLDMKTALADLSSEAPVGVVAHAGEGFFRDLIWYLGHPLAMAVSAGGAVLAMAGFTRCLLDRTRSRWLLVSFPTIFLLFIAMLPLRLRHWIMPLVPFLCVLAGLALVETVRLLRRQPALQGALWPVFLVLTITLPMAKTDLIRGRELKLPDTRTLAGEWILSHISPGQSLVMEAWTPQLPTDRYQFLVVDRKGQLIDAVAEQRHKQEAERRTYERRAQDPIFIPYGQLGKLEDLSAIDRASGDYLVMTDKVYQDYVAEGAACEPCERVIRTYDTLMASGEVVYAIEPIAGELRGPKVTIFRLGGDRAPALARFSQSR